MRYLHLTLATPAENLACDEALLDACEDGADECLRLWEPRQPFVVLGYANRREAEVNVAACRAARVPILRRCSGGGTVLQAPGCLNYSLILRIPESGALASLTDTTNVILTRHADALAPLLGRRPALEGTSDLALDGRKFSGNAQRRRQHALLFHGTFLLHCDLALIERALRPPPRQPAYRRGRGHAEFLMNLECSATRIAETLRTAWDADGAPTEIPARRIESLVAERYGSEAWTNRS